MMNKNEGFNKNENAEKEFENNIFDILSNEKEDNEENKNKEFELKNDEIEIYSPEVIEHLLGQKTNLEINLIDERLSTVEAENILLSGDVSRMGRKKVIDAVAASIILDTYLRRMERR